MTALPTRSSKQGLKIASRIGADAKSRAGPLCRRIGVTHSVHAEGFDSFAMSAYHEGGVEMIAALRAGGAEVTDQPSLLWTNLVRRLVEKHGR